MIFKILPLYIDPGTGSLIISFLLSLSLGIIFSIKNIYFKFIFLLSGRNYTVPYDFDGKLVFFCEGKNYWRVFEPVITELIKKKFNFIYLSADKNDPGLNLNSDFCESHYLGNLNQAFLILNKLKAKMCVATTPQLNILAWKLSKNVKHYCYLSHAPMDVHANKKFSFDYYDSILCGNEFQIKNLRYLEEKRNSKKKILKKTGCTYFDLLKKNSENNGDHVLISPTWGERSFFGSNGKKLIFELLKGGYKVLYRPHPQSWISESDLIKSIKNKFNDNPLFAIDKKITNEEALMNSKIVITDINSGMIYDIALIYKIPIIAVNHEFFDGGYESSNLINEESTKVLLKKTGKIISEKEIHDTNKFIESVSDIEISKQLISEHLFNFQKAGKVAASQIINLFKKI